MKKVLGLKTDFPTWGSGKGPENSQGLWLWKSVGFDYRTYKTGETHSWRVQTKPCVHQDSGERSSDPTRDSPRVVCEGPGVSGWGWIRGGLLQSGGNWVWQCMQGTFWRRSPLYTLPPPQFELRSSYREGTQSHPSTKNWIKSLLSMAPCIRTRLSFPHSQSLPIRTIHKPLILMSECRQNENHNHRKLIKLVTWTTTLSNSMKLWAMSCRATQARRVMVESPDKTRSTGEGNGKPLQ